MPIEIEQLFDQIDNIPKVPEVVKTLISQVNSDHADFATIASNVEKEQIISMQVLRLVNSAYYSLPRKIGSIQQALILIGMNELKKLIITSGIIQSVDKVPGINLDDFWIDNFRTACYGEWLAKYCMKENSDMIFTAGLISSLGKILIHLGAPDAAKQIAEKVKAGYPLVDTERQFLGFTHQEACAELCRQWQFSGDLIDTVIKSAAPLSFKDISRPACIVNIAKYISESSYSEKTQDEILIDFPHKEWLELGLSNSEIEDKMLTLYALDTSIDGILD